MQHCHKLAEAAVILCRRLNATFMFNTIELDYEFENYKQHMVENHGKLGDVDTKIGHLITVDKVFCKFATKFPWVSEDIKFPKEPKHLW